MSQGRAMNAEERRRLERALSAHQRGEFDAALRDYNALLAAFPQNAALLSNRASIHLALDEIADAERDARAAIAVDPNAFGAWFNLGFALRRRGEMALASSAFQRASALRPGDARALLEWFSAAARSQQFAGIDARIREAMPALSPLRALALQSAVDLGQHGATTAAFVVLSQLRRELPGDGEVIARHALETEYAKAAWLEQQRQTHAALAAADDILRRAPDHRGTRLLRASILSERGESARAIAEFREITARISDDAICASALLIALQHDPDIDATAIAEAHRAWATRHMPHVAPARAADNPGRHLRIGWISPRFFSGLVGTFFLPVLRRLDRRAMTHVLYDNGSFEDATNAQFRDAADEWHRVDTLDDTALCERIRADRIDVLVELSGHSPGNRLRALGRRPAAVQVSWLDYFHSTGTNAVDVILSDAVLTPTESEANYSERVIRLPSGRLCYTPPDCAPEIGNRGVDTLRFCSFNRVDKVNDRVLACWARILADVPESVLRLKARAFDSGDDREYFIARATRHGIDARRLELSGYSDHGDTLSAYRDCDIALDTFPFSGCATSFDALWMGVPVVTRPGDSMVSRQTASILRSLGLDDCIAADDDSYASAATALAADRERRVAIRNALRARMRERVCDVPRHARELGDALREAWRLSCCREMHPAR